MYTPVVTFCPASLDACALWRFFIPHLHVPASRFYYKEGPMEYAHVGGSDVCVVQRQATIQNLGALRRMREMGIKLVYDLDDNLWNLPAANPGKAIFKQVREGLGTCASVCHALTVSTGPLASAVRTALGQDIPITVVPNAIDLDLYKRVPVHRESKVVVGFAGSNTHAGDVPEVWSLLPELLEEEPSMYLEFAGMAGPEKLIGHPRVTQRHWVPTSEYPTRFGTWAWDVVLAPLDDNRFNRSKSSIRMLESGAIGAPCLASPVQPYADLCSLDPALEYLLCRSRRAWKEKILTLVRDAAQRQHYAGALRRVVHTYFNIREVSQLWRRVFSEVVTDGTS